MFAKEILDQVEVVLTACRDNGLKLAIAESCTGGLICAAITGVSGSSEVLERGFVTYSNLAKNEVLGVHKNLFIQVGSVSEEVARAMAEGALRYSDADMAAACTGIAGPGGGSETKPVGLVHMAVARQNFATLHASHIFAGDRDAIRIQTVMRVLEMLAEVAMMREKGK